VRRQHSERIRLLTERLDRQRKSITKLSFAIGFVVALQFLEVLRVAVDGTTSSLWPILSRSMARGVLIGALSVLVLFLLFRRRFRSVWDQYVRSPLASDLGPTTCQRSADLAPSWARTSFR